MPRHLAAFQQSVDSATPVAINAVNDGILNLPSATRFRVPEALPFVHWGYASGVNLTRAYLVTPTLEVARQRPEIIPHERGAAVITPAELPIWIPPTPVALTPTEDLQAFISEDGAGATQVDVLVSLGDGQQEAIPSGDIRIVRATGTTTLVARTWTNCPMTLDQGLEPGQYVLIGFLPISATVIAARANIVGEPYRDGTMGIAGAEGVAREFAPLTLDLLTDRPMGTFSHQEFPSFEFYATAGDTAEVVLAKLAKVG